MKRLGLENKTVRIYTLSHPETDYVFYVGRTTMRLDLRLSCHWTNNQRTTPKYESYMKKLRADRVIPIIREIDRCSYSDRTRLEEYWVQQFATWGFDLVNYRHNKNKSYQPRVRKTVKLSEYEKNIIDLLYRKGDDRRIAERLGVSPELIRINKIRGTMLIQYKDGVIKYYHEVASKIIEGFNYLNERVA